MELSAEVRVYLGLVFAVLFIFLRFAPFGGSMFPILFAVVAVYYSAQVRKTKPSRGKILLIISSLVLTFAAINFVLGYLKLYSFLNILG